MSDVGDKPRLDILSFGLYAFMESCIVSVLQDCRFSKGWQTNAFMCVNPVDLIADGLFFLYFDLFL